MKPWNQILRELREDHDFSQAKVAKVLGTTQQVYSRYENGINEIPLHHLRTLCLYYQVSADVILSIPKYKKEKLQNYTHEAQRVIEA
ncbi:MAG: helix-turn-helix transcriptional regulator [Clostridia bacterium]|nr:helix-turn-helix transcriptional regulator [Clostridia bacterium]